VRIPWLWRHPAPLPLWLVSSSSPLRPPACGHQGRASHPAVSAREQRTGQPPYTHSSPSFLSRLSRARCADPALALPVHGDSPWTQPPSLSLSLSLSLSRCLCQYQCQAYSGDHLLAVSRATSTAIVLQSGYPPIAIVSSAADERREVVRQPLFSRRYLSRRSRAVLGLPQRLYHAIDYLALKGGGAQNTRPGQAPGRDGTPPVEARGGEGQLASMSVRWRGPEARQRSILSRIVAVAYLAALAAGTGVPLLHRLQEGWGLQQRWVMRLADASRQFSVTIAVVLTEEIREARTVSRLSDLHCEDQAP